MNCPGVYPVGRLDADSEGLLLLTDHGVLQQRLLDPRRGHWRRYLVQVEGLADDDQLEPLRAGVLVQGRRTLPAQSALAWPRPCAWGGQSRTGRRQPGRSAGWGSGSRH